MREGGLVGYLETEGCFSPYFCLFGKERFSEIQFNAAEVPCRTTQG